MNDQSKPAESPPVPYAYSISEYDSHSVYPTLAAAAIGAKESGWTPDRLWHEDVVTAHFNDGTNIAMSLKEFIEKVEVNEVAVAIEIDRLREAARREDDKRLREFFETNGRYPGLVTGIAPIYMLDRVDLITREVAKRSYRWK